MARIIGRTGVIGIAIEDVRATGQASDFWVPITGLDFDDKVSYIDNDSALGRIEEKNQSDANQFWADGSYEGKIFDKSVGVELSGLFGQLPTSVQRGASGVYDHTYSVLNSNLHQALTINYKDTNQTLRFALGMIDSWSLEAELENYLRRTVNIIAKPSTSVANTVAITNENEFIPKNMTMKQATTIAGLGAGTAISIRAFKMEVSKNAEALYVLGSSSPDNIVNKQMTVTGSFEAYFDDEVQRNLWLAGSNRCIRFDAVNTAVDLGSTHNPQLRFDLANCKLEFERSWDANDILIQTISFEAMYSIAESAMIAGRLTNAQASYA